MYTQKFRGPVSDRGPIPNISSSLASPYKPTPPAHDYGPALTRWLIDTGDRAVTTVEGAYGSVKGQHHGYIEVKIDRV